MSYGSALGYMLKVMGDCKLAFYFSYRINKLIIISVFSVKCIAQFLLWNHDEYELMWCGQDLIV
jgi:hypothetical protein